MDYPSISSFFQFLILLQGLSRSQTQDLFFDPSPIDQDAIEGGPATLRCDVSSRQQIVFWWTMNDKRIGNNSRRHMRDSNLRISQVSRTQDAGSFRCIAMNITTGISVKSSAARLNVHWISKAASVRIESPASRDRLRVGSSVRLRCECPGNAPPSVEWMKNGKRLTNTEEWLTRKSELHISRLGIKHNGVYTCRAHNRAGRVTSAENFLLNVKDGNLPHLDETSFRELVLAARDATVFLHCDFGAPVQVVWRHNERRLESDGRLEIFPNGTVRISSVTPRDVGTYTCVGSPRSHHQSFSSRLQLAFIKPIQPDWKPDSLRVVALGSKAALFCPEPLALPAPSLRWLQNDITVPSRRVDDGVVVEVDNAAESDSGNYSCVASNMAGSESVSLRLVVSVAPKVIENPRSLRVSEGSIEAVFACQVSGTPYPVTRIGWRRNGETVVAAEDTRLLVDEQRGTLQITNVKVSDEGVYTCVAATKGHSPELSTNARLYVRKKLKFKPIPSDVKIELDSNAKVFCHAEGDATPEVSWYRAGIKISDSPESRTRSTNGVLHVDQVAREDMGVYTCAATSAQGQINATITVGVVVKPRFKVRPTNLTILEGRSVMLHCVAIGDPVPTIHWDHNEINNLLDPARFTLLANGTLSISEVYMEDSGVYGCTAGNSGGLVRAEMRLHVTTSSDGVAQQQQQSLSMMNTIVIAVCSAVAYLAVVIGLTVYCSLRLMKAKNLRKNPAIRGKTQNGHVSEHTELMEKSSSIAKPDTLDTRSHVSGMSSSQHSSSLSARTGHTARSGLLNGQLSFPRQALQTLGMLGKTAYGDVFLAKAHGLRDVEDPDSPVVVKSLVSREDAQLLEFRRLQELHSRPSHPHIVKLLGTCLEMEPHFLIMEYCQWGDLKQFLWATRADNPQRNAKLAPLNTLQQVVMCRQVASALDHLSHLRLIHRDVAARNVLLTPNLTLKLASLSLSRDVYASEYANVHGRVLPLRWTAPESLLAAEFTSRSDVWSFGVFCWEVFSLCDLPHHTRNDESVVRALRAGELMLEPLPVCPLPLEETITRCTRDEPQARPTFSQILAELTDIDIAQL